jgi:hypothetical protein
MQLKGFWHGSADRIDLMLGDERSDLRLALMPEVEPAEVVCSPWELSASNNTCHFARGLHRRTTPKTLDAVARGGV